MITTTFENKNTKFAQSDLIGSWKLVEFLIEDLTGKTNHWGENCTGLLLYTKDNQMSVSINRKVEAKSDIEEKNFFDSILFYSGVFKTDSVNENNPELLKNPFTNSNITIKHSVQHASNPNRIGKELLRYVGYDTTTDKNIYMTLSSPVESFGRGVIRWKKIA
ncbi:MAG: lipocalin-like domain-containing protein [Bdellovibrionaceae bacterium]|nr:lipocalin-like domain-containing protein [Pseudobdellovibrionaceae bacterium]